MKIYDPIYDPLVTAGLQHVEGLIINDLHINLFPYMFIGQLVLACTQQQGPAWLPNAH